MLYTLLLFLHFIGLICGMGGAFVTDYLFFKFLADAKISNYEQYIIKTVSNFIVFGTMLLLISGIGLILVDISILYKPLFILKLFLVLIIFLNGIFLHFKVIKDLSTYNFKTNKKFNLNIKTLLGGVLSFITWIYILFIAVTKGFYLNILTLFSIYIFFLLFTFILVYTKKYNK